MPKLNGWYQSKKPHLQVNILKSMALRGRLSQKEAISRFRSKPSTISEAFKILKTRRKLIQNANAPKLEKLDKLKGIRREKFYKLLPRGLEVFIDENPSPYEFWIAIMWYSSLNPGDFDENIFNKYYNLFIQKFIGNSSPLRSCFFLGNFFENLFQKWCKKFDYSYYRSKSMVPDYTYYETKKAFKVLECLLLNRGITIKKIVELTELTEQEVRKTLKDYSITQTSYSHYIDYYEGVYQSSRSLDLTIDLLDHLVIIPVKVEEETNNCEDERYELSLLGVLLMLATISLMRKRQEGSYFVNYYSRIASNYQGKLPLIFGKWGLLKNILNFDLFPSIFDYLLGGDKSEILSLSVSVGGNKEIYDNIRSGTLSTISKFFMVYDEGISALQSDDYPENFVNSKHCRFIEEKINEIEISLRYTNLESFAKYMKGKKSKSDSNLVRISPTFKNIPDRKVSEILMINSEDFKFEGDLHFIEEALAEEFSFLFYVGLLRENNHKASDYPLTIGFMKPSPNLVYPKDFLIQIVASDDQIHNKLKEWITESTSYQKLALEKMDHIYFELNNR